MYARISCCIHSPQLVNAAAIRLLSNSISRRRSARLRLCQQRWHGGARIILPSTAEVIISPAGRNDGAFSTCRKIPQICRIRGTQQQCSASTESVLQNCETPSGLSAPSNMEHSNELIEVSVGGTRYTSTVTTLLGPVAQGSMLARLVALHGDCLDASDTGNTCSPDSTASGLSADVPSCLTDHGLDGALFIDRDGALFRYVLAYLRDGEQFVPPADLPTTQQLLVETRYYQLDGPIGTLQLHKENLCKVGMESCHLRPASGGIEWMNCRISWHAHVPGVMPNVRG